MRAGLAGWSIKMISDDDDGGGEIYGGAMAGQRESTAANGDAGWEFGVGIAPPVVRRDTSMRST